MTISVRALDVRSRLPLGLIGMLDDTSYLNEKDSALNVDPQAEQVSTITLDTITNSVDYTVTIDGIEITVTSDSSAVNTEIGDDFVEAINAHPLLRGRMEAERTSATVVTLTGLLPGQTFTITDSDAKITTATGTAADSADAVPFGRLIIRTSDGITEGVRTCALAASTKMTAQVDSWAITYENTIILNVEVTVDGVSYSVSHTMATDRDTSIDALVVKVNAVMAGLPAATVIATADAGTATALVLTSEVAGKPFTSRVWLGVGATAAAPALTRTAPASSDVNQYALGISLHTYAEQASSAGSSAVEYPANAGVIFGRKGRIIVALSESISYDGAPVYVELGASNSGKFYATDSATRVRLNRAVWERADGNGDSTGILRLSAS